MENLNFELLLLAFLGMIIHVLMKISERGDKKHKPSFKYWISDRMNLVRLFLSITSILALLMMKDDIINLLGIELSDGSPATKIFTFGAGYLNHSFIRNVLKIFKKKTEADE